MSEHASTSVPRFALARLIAGHICVHACMSGMRMAAPLMALHAGMSTLAVGFLMAMFALTQVFLALPAGRYTDRHGMRRPVGWGVTAAATGAGLAVLFPVFPVLCLSALLTGGATGVTAIALQRQVGRSVQHASELKRVFGWLSLGPAVANFIGPFVCGLLIDHVGVWLGGQPADDAGFRVAFFLMALLPLVAWWCVHTAREVPAKQPMENGPQRAWDLLREPMMRRLLLVNWFLSSCWDVHTFVVPVLGHERGFSASVIGTLLGIFALAAAGVRMTLPWLAAHLREWVVVTGAMLITATLLSVYPLMTSAWSMGVCSVLLGISLGSVQPMIMSTLHQITPAHRQGEALGLRLMSLNGSSVFMPVLFGTVGAVVGVSVVFWSVAAVVGLGARLAWHLRPPAQFPH